MKRRVISAILCAVMIFSNVIVFADDISDGKTKKVVTLSLKQAIDCAIERNPQFEALEVSRKADEYALYLARQNWAKTQKVVVSMPAGIEMALVQDGYYVSELEGTLNLLSYQKKQAEASIAYSVTEKYYNSILMNNMLSSAKNAYNLALRNQKAVLARYELGAITKIEVDNAELAVAKARLEVENYERQLALCMEMLKIAMEYSDEEMLSTDLVLTDLPEAAEFVADVNSDAELAKNQRYDMISLKTSVDSTKRYTDLMRSYLGTKSTTYVSANDNLTTLTYNYNNAKKQIGVLIKSQYSSVLLAKGKITTAEMALSVMKGQYEAAKLRYELGMITNIELADSLNSLYNSEIALLQAKMEYMLAVEKYKYEVEIGL